MPRAILRTLLLASFGFAASLAAPDAHACGGTFCDKAPPGPMQMSVDQKGENILFVSDGTSVEAHIQIQYDGKDAKRFAWIIPVQSNPTSIGVGSQQLFTNLLQGTVPTYGFNTVNDCPPPPVCKSFGSGAGGTGASAGAAGGSSLGAGGGAGPGTQVTFKATVGSFDVVVLGGGTADDLMTWLSDNQYQEIPSAKPIFEDYLASGHLFVAVKMANGAGVDEIHPLVIRYDGQAPCVPLKLTAVAAVEDMGVRAFFLGNGRWVPSNYKHMVLNQARLDWSALASNYDDVIHHAADEPVDDGHAFVTEYAGSSAIIPQNGLFSPLWDPTPFPKLAVTQVVHTLQSQGLIASCTAASCTFAHPLIAGLLHEFLPTPAGINDAAFYGCLSCYTGSIDLTKWDGEKFSQALISRVIAPGARAQAILQQNPYATRLFTTISPSEMTVDPEFHERADLPQVNEHELATRHLKCSATGMDLPDGREIALAGGLWPTWDASMPWVERVEEIPLAGPTIVLVDNKAVIDDAVLAWNTARSWPPPPPVPQSCPGKGGTGGATSGGVTGVGGAQGGADGAGAAPEPSGGCSTTGGRATGVGGAWLAGLLLALVGRGRPRRAKVGKYFASFGTKARLRE